MDHMQEEALKNLTERLSYDDIILYRKLANASIKREERKKQEAQKQKGISSPIHDVYVQAGYLVGGDPLSLRSKMYQKKILGKSYIRLSIILLTK